MRGRNPTSLTVRAAMGPGHEGPGDPSGLLRQLRPFCAAMGPGHEGPGDVRHVLLPLLTADAAAMGPGHEGPGDPLNRPASDPCLVEVEPQWGRGTKAPETAPGFRCRLAGKT